MKRFDAIVVGGGPAGSTCAAALVRAGMRVGLLDRKPFPRDKVCAGWVTPAVLTLLGLERDRYAAGRVFQPIRAFRTGLIDGDAALTTDYGETVSYGIRRYEFDHFLLQRCGAELLLEEPLTVLHRTQGEWLVNGHWRAPLLIGAGGHSCPVARHLGADLGRREQPVTAQELEFPLTGRQRDTCAVRGDTPELYFSRDLRGYGWCLRKGDWLNVGLGREGKGPLAAQVEAFVAFLRRTGRIAALPARPFGHAYLLYRRPAPRPRVGDGVLLVGDAAGLAYPQSGEGIRPAVESARIAADTILGAGGDYRRVRLEAYEERLHAHFGRGGRATPPGPLARWIGRTLLANRTFTRRVVLDRWFLHRHPAVT